MTGTEEYIPMQAILHVWESPYLHPDADGVARNIPVPIKITYRDYDWWERDPLNRDLIIGVFQDIPIPSQTWDGHPASQRIKVTTTIIAASMVAKISEEVYPIELPPTEPLPTPEDNMSHHDIMARLADLTGHPGYSKTDAFLETEGGVRVPLSSYQMEYDGPPLATNDLPEDGGSVDGIDVETDTDVDTYTARDQMMERRTDLPSSYDPKPVNPSHLLALRGGDHVIEKVVEPLPVAENAANAVKQAKIRGQINEALDRRQEPMVLPIISSGLFDEPPVIEGDPEYPGGATETPPGFIPAGESNAG